MVEIVPEKPAIGKAFKKEGKIVMDYLAQMDKDSIKEFEDKLTGNGWVLKKILGLLRISVFSAPLLEWRLFELVSLHLRYTIGSKSSRHFFIQSEVKLKANTFSRAFVSYMYLLRVLIGSLDCLCPL